MNRWFSFSCRFYPPPFLDFSHIAYTTYTGPAPGLVDIFLQCPTSSASNGRAHKSCWFNGRFTDVEFRFSSLTLGTGHTSAAWCCGQIIARVDNKRQKERHLPLLSALTDRAAWDHDASSLGQTSDFCTEEFAPSATALRLLE